MVKSYAGPQRARHARAIKYAMMFGNGLSIRTIATRERVTKQDVRYMLRHACPPFVKGKADGRPLWQGVNRTTTRKE